MKCKNCGTLLCDGMKFCHECGRLVGAPATPETIEIPIADIEKNILLETEHEIGATIKKTKTVPKQPMQQASQHEKTVEKRKPVKPESVSAKTKKKAEMEKPIREKISKKKVYEADWEDNEAEYEEYEENDHNIMTIVTVVMAFLIFAIAAFLIFSMVRKQPIKNYGESIESVQDAENGESDNSGEGATGNVGAEGLEIIGILTIVSNVNVRDNPSTEGTNIIKVAKAGEMYQYCGQAEDENWYIILLEDGSIGYVFKDYISVK